MIYLVGLGPGNPRALPFEAMDILLSGRPVLTRTLRHPVWHLPGPLSDAVRTGRTPVTALDDEYENNATFDDTYDAIVARVLRAGAGNTNDASAGVVYAVPGHPLFGETTVARIIARARAENISTKIVGAPSFVDACLEAIGQAMTGDLQIVDALGLRPDDPAPADVLRSGAPLLLYQVHSREAASNAKLALMRAGYPDDFVVTCIQAAGVPDAQAVQEMPLFALDRGAIAPDHLTTIWVPFLPAGQRRPGLPGLVRIMARLRDPHTGCPWDLKQTPTTLKRYVIEEAYEVVDAIESSGGDPDDLCEELGDLLLQIVFHAQIAAEEGLFDAEDVCASIVEKLIRRHPHIFGDVTVADADEVLVNWNAIKATEKGKESRTSILDGVPPHLPALMRALEISKRAVKVGFEWPDTAGVLAKVDEEIAELRVEVETHAPRNKIAGELGDLLFTLVNVARHLGIDPEEALRGQLARFTRRFQHIEAGARAQNRALDTLTLAEMDAFWQDAKRLEQ